MFFFSLLQLAIDYHRAKSDMRQRRASESDSILDKEESTPKNVDILQMLSKAQHEYDRVTPNTIEMLTGVEGNIALVSPFWIKCSHMQSKLLYFPFKEGHKITVA